MILLFIYIQGIPLKIPMIDKKYLDLYSLHKVCQLALRYVCCEEFTIIITLITALGPDLELIAYMNITNNKEIYKI